MPGGVVGRAAHADGAADGGGAEEVLGGAVGEAQVFFEEQAGEELRLCAYWPRSCLQEQSERVRRAVVRARRAKWSRRLSIRSLSCAHLSCVVL